MESLLGNPCQRKNLTSPGLIARPSLPESPVGIDAQFTHAIIIAFLKQISNRLDDIESRLRAMQLSDDSA